MLRRIITSACFLLLALLINAQSISVSSFKLLDTDLTANTAGTMEQDQNGETAALIKVVTTQTGFSFDCGSMGIVKTLQKPSEIWVYVPRGIKKMTVSHPLLGLLRDYYFPLSIDAARTYEMVLTTGVVQTTVKQTRTSQYVVFQLTPPDAVVELDGTTLKTSEGIATMMMKFGTYDYRVQAPNYKAEAGKVTIDDPQNKKTVIVTLQPNFSNVTVKVDNNAEIWVNGEKKGDGTWTGNLGKGIYEFEAKLPGHRSTTTTKDIIVTQESQTITLQSPIPIYGDVEVDSEPAMADIYIDGKSYGKTPQVIQDLLIGNHQLRINKDNYKSYSFYFLIKENETTSISAQLEKGQDFDTSSSNQSISPEQHNAYVKSARDFMIMSTLTTEESQINRYRTHAYNSFIKADFNKLTENELIDFVRASFYSGHIQDALRGAEAGAKMEPDDAFFNRMAMVSSYELHNPEKAKVYFHRLFNESNNARIDENDLCFAAYIHEDLGENFKARDYYLKALNAINKSSTISQCDIFKRLARLCLNDKDFENSINYFKKYISTTPNLTFVDEEEYAEIYNQWASMDSSRKKELLNKAISIYKKASRKFPEKRNYCIDRCAKLRIEAEE